MNALDAARHRLALLQAGDFAALHAWLAPQLVYTHSNGVRQNRSQYERFAQTQIQLIAAHYKELVAVPCGSCILLSGCLHQTIMRAHESTPVAVESWVTEVWQETDGQWQLLAFQSTKVLVP